MRCSICDRELSDKEVTWNDELQDWEICTTCLEISLEAAFSDGYQAEEDDSFVVLSDDLFYGDSSDIVYHSWSKYSE